MEKAILVLVGVSCLVSSGFVLFKLAPRDGEPVRAWLENDGVATIVSLALTLVATLGIGLVIQALTT